MDFCVLSVLCHYMIPRASPIFSMEHLGTVCQTMCPTRSVGSLLIFSIPAQTAGAFTLPHILVKIYTMIFFLLSSLLMVNTHFFPIANYRLQ